MFEKMNSNVRTLIDYLNRLHAEHAAATAELESLCASSSPDRSASEKEKFAAANGRIGIAVLALAVNASSLAKEGLMEMHCVQLTRNGIDEMVPFLTEKGAVDAVRQVTEEFPLATRLMRIHHVVDVIARRVRRDTFMEAVAALEVGDNEWRAGDARQRDAYEYMDVLANQHYREYESLRRVLVHAQHGHDALAYRRFFGFKIDGALVFGMVAANESVQSMATARFYNAANARSLAVSMISDRESAPVMSDDDVVKSTDIVMLDDDEWAAFDALVTVQLSKYQIYKQK